MTRHNSWRGQTHKCLRGLEKPLHHVMLSWSGWAKTACDHHHAQTFLPCDASEVHKGVRVQVKCFGFIDLHTLYRHLLKPYLRLFDRKWFLPPFHSYYQDL